MPKTYKIECTEEEFNTLVQLLDTLIKAGGLQLLAPVALWVQKLGDTKTKTDNVENLVEKAVKVKPKAK